MSLPLSESSSPSSGPTGFIFLSKSACIDNVKNSGSYTSARLVSLGPSASELDLGGMTEDELVARIQSLSIENDELRAVLQHNNGLLENHFKDLANMQTTQKQRSEHLTKAHEKAKDVVKKLRGKNRGLEKNLQEAHDKLAELEMQLSLKDASTEESGDQEGTKEDKNETLKEVVMRLKEEKKTLVVQNQLLQEHINKVRTISESEQELIASVASSDVWSGSDLISSEFGSAAGTSDSTDSKFNTELEIIKVDLAQVRVENEQKELLLRELRSDKEELENQCCQRERELRQNNDLLTAAKEQADEQRRQLEIEKTQLEVKYQQLQADEQCRQLEIEKMQLEVKYQQLQANKEQVTEQLQQSPERKVIFHKVPDSEEMCRLEMAEKRREGAEADLTKQLMEARLRCEALQTELDQTKAEKKNYKEQVDSFNARYKEAEENAKAFDLGNDDPMKQKYDAMKKQLWRYQDKEGEIKDKEEALLAREGEFDKLEQDNNALSKKVETLQLQLAEFRQKETALQDEINVRQQEIDASKKALEEALQTQTNLQEQLEDNSRVHAQVDGCRAEIEVLQQQLQETSAEAESKLEMEMRTHEEASEALKQQLQEALDESDRAEHLRAQVCQLIQENHSLEAKFQDMSKENSDREEFYSQRMTMMEQDHRSQCQQKDSVIESLRKNLSDAEDEFRKGKTQQEISRKSYDELLTQHEQVMGEYNAVVHNFQATMKAEKKRKESSSAEITNLLVQVDNLTAQLVTAEEAIQKKDDECNAAKERLQEVNNQLEGIPIMRTQLEVYQSDFQAERDAREKEHAEVTRLREENHQLQVDIQRAQDELDRHNNAQLTTMQLRHGGDEHRSPPPPMSTGYQGADPDAGWFGTWFTRRGPGEEAGTVPGDVAGGEARGEERRGEQPSEEGNCWSCPQCQQRFPDFDSLQIHAVDCNGRQEQQQAAPWCPKCGNFYPDMDTLQIHIIECLDD